MRVAVVPARLASTRLPQKMLADLAGLPLFAHAALRCEASELFDRVLVATPDPAIHAAAEELGLEVVRTGPAPTGTHRVAAAAPKEATVVVNVQGDLPVFDEDLLPAALAALEAADIGTVWAPLDGDPHEASRVKVRVDNQGRADFSRRPFAGASPWVHVGVYAFRPASLARAVAAPRTGRCVAEDLEQLAWVDGGMAIGARGIARAPLSVDTKADLDRLRSRFHRGLAHVPALRSPVLYSQGAPR